MMANDRSEETIEVGFEVDFGGERGDGLFVARRGDRTGFGETLDAALDSLLDDERTTLSNEADERLMRELEEVPIVTRIPELEDDPAIARMIDRDHD